MEKDKAKRKDWPDNSPLKKHRLVENMEAGIIFDKEQKGPVYGGHERSGDDKKI